MLSFSPTEEYHIIPCESSAAHWTANQTSLPVSWKAAFVFSMRTSCKWGLISFCVFVFSRYFENSLWVMCALHCVWRVADHWCVVWGTSSLIAPVLGENYKMMMEQIINRSSTRILVFKLPHMGCLAWNCFLLFSLHGIQTCKSLHTAPMWESILFLPPLCDRGFMHIFNYKITLIVHMNV